MPVVKDGDCMVSLADALGMQDYHTLYDDAVNATLKADRPNPNQLVVGDDVKLPPGKGKVHAKAVDAVWTFVVKAKKPAKLRIALVDAEAKGLAGKEWRLTTPQALSGKTKGNGLIEIANIPLQAVSAALEVTWRKTTPPKPVAPPKSKKITDPTYPRPIVVADFTDDAPPAHDAADDVASFTLKVGSLPSHNVDDGVRARLNNLGHGCAPGATAEVTMQAVKAFQRARQKQDKPSGLVSDVRPEVRKQHDQL